MPAHDDAELDRRIGEARSLCRRRLAEQGRAYTGRSPGLRPLSQPWEFVDRENHARTLHASWEVVEVLVAARREAGVFAADDAPEHDGRLACFRPLQTAWFELMMSLSNGILDAHDEIGWDLWVCIDDADPGDAWEFG